MILIFVATGIFLIYAAVIFRYTRTLYGMKPYKTRAKDAYNIFVSILIPIRNEADNIPALLADLARQTFPKHLFEIIIIDDHSTDDSIPRIREFQKNHPEIMLQIIENKQDNKISSFKKNAITEGIKVAAGELIITMDADVSAGKEYLVYVVNYYLEKNPKMITGPVGYHQEKTLFEKLQALEFFSLTGITAAAVEIRKPVMCNGANLAYPKAVFTETGGFGADGFVSGDDIFLLMKIKEKYGAESIRFLWAYEAMVWTRPQPGLKDFLHQRARWASKNKHFQKDIFSVAITVFSVNLILVLLLAGSLFSLTYSAAFLIFQAIKILIDYPLTKKILKFARKEYLLKYFVPLSLVYPYYIVVSAIKGMAGKFNWKERTYSK